MKFVATQKQSGTLEDILHAGKEPMQIQENMVESQ